MAECSIEGCNRKVKARGWCGAHHTRWLKYGDPCFPYLRVRTYDPNRKEKRCTGCLEVWPLDQFYINNAHSDGRMSRCKHCVDQRQAKVVKSPRQKQAATDGRRKKQLANFGVQELDQCEICGAKSDSSRNRRVTRGHEIPKAARLALDHNHTTGEYRGQLCSCCNMLIGYGNDDPEILRKAALYLEERTRMEDVA